MSGIGWLLRRDLRARPRALAAVVLVVAVTVALTTAIELLARGREVEVTHGLAALGPALRVVPPGRTATDLARFELGDGGLPEASVAPVRRLLGAEGRADARLRVRLPLDGRPVPVVGQGPGAFTPPPAEGTVALGSVLAARLGLGPGRSVSLGGTARRVARVLDPTGSAEDLAVLAPLTLVQTLSGRPGRVNELRLFPGPGADPGTLASRLSEVLPAHAVLYEPRGAEAEAAIGSQLTGHRLASWLLAALTAAAAVGVATLLEARRREKELATLMALGAARQHVILLFAARGAALGVLGALAGWATGVAVIGAGGEVIATRALWLLGGLLPVTVAVCVAAAAPVALLVTGRDPAAALQA